MGNNRIDILMYADDIALISESEESLQNMLNSLYQWSKKWQIKFNHNKTNVVHFRNKNIPRTNYVFNLGDDMLQTVDKYKYLGLILNEFLDFTITSQVLADSAGRALGSIMNKYKQINGLPYSVYTKLYNACVCPILYYCSEIWGFKEHNTANLIQNRAIRFFLGVHNFASNAAINGDMGWTPAHIRHKINMLRFWNRLIEMDNERITKKVFMYELNNMQQKTWCAEVKQLLSLLGLSQCFDELSCIDLEQVLSQLNNKHKENWMSEIENKPKLRTYRIFKYSFEVEPYIYCKVSPSIRSTFAKLRCGILPLEIETGRWKNKPTNERICKLCNQNEIEDECHFLFSCPFYENIRNNMYSELENYCPGFKNLDTNAKLKNIMKDDSIKTVMECVNKMYKKRYGHLFQQ